MNKVKQFFFPLNSWETLSKPMKALWVSYYAVGIAMLTFFVLYFTNILVRGFSYACICVAVGQFLQFLYHLKYHKGQAVFALFMSIIFVALTVRNW